MKNILYWGNRKIGTLLKQESQNVYIAKNFLEFESLINQFSYCVFYIESTRTCLNKMLEIVRKNPGKNFYVLSRIDSKYPNPNSLSLIFDEKNVIHRVFNIKEFVAEIPEA